MSAGVFGGLCPGNFRNNSGLSDCDVCRGSADTAEVQIMRARIRTVVTVGSAAALVMALGFGASPVLASAPSGEAPGAPGAASDWVTGDKMASEPPAAPAARSGTRSTTES